MEVERKANEIEIWTVSVPWAVTTTAVGDVDHWALQGLCSLADPNPQQAQTWSSELCFK